MRPIQILITIMALAAAGFALVSCGSDDDAGTDVASAATTGPTSAPTVAKAQVLVLDNVYEPRLQNAKVGQVVEWKWDSSNQHSVTGTFNGQKIDSGTKSGNETFTFTFDQAGTFEYSCSVHGASMSGQVIIQ